ncbi:MAG: LuxR C-terminal-related transcriptional regulator [Candidatus Caenarcaniphilales bacterium]|nr:LuxR C-terminal-related transcriptional regulator [Candidatus Caenarcaniphilales bacterium]
MPKKQEKLFIDKNRNSLSQRELEVLSLVKEGLKNPEIAESLGLSIKTIENHIRSILLKLDAKNRTDAVILAIKNSILKI